jgi:CheY-like chemotaxis protein
VLKPPGKLDDLSHSRLRGSERLGRDRAFCVGERRLRDAEGIAKAETELPDLVLIDIQLPVLDCCESTRRIKALLGMARTTIIAVSSFAMQGDEEKARAASCDGYVTKP